MHFFVKHDHENHVHFASAKPDTLHFAYFEGSKSDISHFAYAKSDTSYFEGAKSDTSHFAPRTLRRQTLSESVWWRTELSQCHLRTRFG